MLLEQHKDAVLNLLSDPKLLEEQVNFAMKMLKEYVTIYCFHPFSSISFTSQGVQSVFYFKGHLLF